MKKRNILITIFGLLTIGVIALAAFGYPRLQQQWNAPLGPGLELPTWTPTKLENNPGEIASNATATKLVDASATETTAPTGGADATQPNTATATQIPTATAEPLCGGPPTMVILGVGADSGIDYLYGLADVIRIVRVDFVTPKVTVLSMPRDLWVEIPDIENPYGVDHGKLNQAYFYGGEGMGYYDGPGAGPGLLARVLDHNFGLRVEHYGAVNMQTFVKIVNAVGGIDLYLATDVDGRPVDDKTEDMGYFYAGQNHFNGDQALRFARIRKKYNDFTRMSHQNMVICALKEKITSPAVLPKIPQIIASFQDSVITDLSPEQISQLACLIPKLKRENLLFTSLPEEILTQGRVFSPQQKDNTFVMQADYDVIRDYVLQFMAGTWPDKPKEPTCP
jgi:LCP family protein required for cell wall assembly